MFEFLDFIWENYSTKKVKKMFLDICNGVQEIHRANIAHLDLSVENVVVDLKTHNAKVIDFGLARTIGNVINPAFGKRELFSPEQSKAIKWRKGDKLGKLRVSRKHDVFQLGMMLFYMLHRQYPFTIFQKGSGNPCTAYKQLLNQQDGEDGFWQWLQDIHELTLTQAAKDLFEKMWKEYPSERISLAEVIKHPFFKDCNEAFSDLSLCELDDNDILNEGRCKIGRVTHQLTQNGLRGDNVAFYFVEYKLCYDNILRYKWTDKWEDINLNYMLIDDQSTNKYCKHFKIHSEQVELYIKDENLSEELRYQLTSSARPPAEQI